MSKGAGAPPAGATTEPKTTSRREIGVRRLRADLASHVRRAGRGDGVVVTVNGRPTARLGPLIADPQGSGPARDAEDLGALNALDALADIGLIRRPIDAGRRLARPDPVVGRYPVDVDPARMVEKALGR